MGETTNLGEFTGFHNHQQQGFLFCAPRKIFKFFFQAWDFVANEMFQLIKKNMYVLA